MLQIELRKKIEVLEPFLPGVNHYLIEVWQGSDGKFYITSMHGTPYPNDLRPTEYIAWEGREIIAGPFNTVEEAEEWYWEGEEL